jgi:hypothetical protein
MSAAAAAATAPAGSDELRRLAASILSERRFRGAPLADPLRPVLRQLGRWLRDLGSGIPGLPGGAAVTWTLIAAFVLGAAVYGARRRLRGLAPAERQRTADGAGPADDARALERDAAQAERRGAFAEAIRLRFRAGLLGLGARGAIDYSASLRTAEVSRRLASVDFDRIASTFERVAYGGDEATEGEAAASREGWQRVLTGAGR